MQIRHLTPLALLATTHFAGAALLAHWPLDTDASDATGNGHDGLVVGGTVTFGQAGANPNTGMAASFPDDGHIDVPFDAAINPGAQAADGSGSFTVALWCNAADTAGFNSPFTAREDNGANVNGPIIYNTPDNIWSYWAGNNGPPGAWNGLNHTEGAIVGEWQHVAITYDADTITRKMFIDGAEVLSAVLGVSANAQRDTHIGAGQDDGLNFFWNGLIDDVGLWDEALNEAEIQNAMDNGVGGALSDPRIIVASLTEAEIGDTGFFLIPVLNGGENLNLNVDSVDIAGPAAANFFVVSLPAPIEPGEEENIVLEFDAMGANGVFEAELELTSDDSLNGSRIIFIRAIVHDPKLIADAELDFGALAPAPAPESAQVAVQNDGAARSLNISGVTVTGVDAVNFTVDAFPATLGTGAAGTIDVTFDAMGSDGTFLAQLEIGSDDPINPTIVVPLTARVAIADPLVAWWPLDADASDGSGNRFDGIETAPITYVPGGANAATGGAAQFFGSEHIDVPWDPALNTQDFSVTLWANAAAAGGGSFRSPITNRDDVAPGGAFRHGWIIYNTNNGQWSFWNGGGTGGMGAWNNVDVGPVPIDEWHHIAITYDSATNTKMFYIDGSSVSTTNPVAFSPNNSVGPAADPGYTYEDEDIHIGGGGDAGTSFRWEGLIDDVGLFRTALTGDDIMAVMSGGVGSLANTAPFEIVSLVRDSPTETTVTWNSRSGINYAVERAVGGLEFNDWLEIDDGTVATGDTASYTDEGVPEAPDVFYRVRVVE